MDQEKSNKTTEIISHTKFLCKLMNLMGNKSLDEFQEINDTQEFCKTLQDMKLPDYGLTTEEMIKNGIIYSAYALIVIISLIGNLMVVYAIFSKRRMRTTVNIFIGNLAISDLMMTIFNIPFSSARLLMDNWIFGDFMCHMAPFLQVVAVYVSTITMAYIAIDRYQAIMSPMGWRISSSVGTRRGIVLIWLLSVIFSIPYGLYSKIVVREGMDRDFHRCQMIWPEPKETIERSVNVGTFILQFAIPFLILSILYTVVGLKIWSRESIGATTIEQQNRQMVAKRKTIFMLLMVAIVFAVCWLPLNVYYLLVDFAQYHNQYMRIGFHWLAMSSVCYNPFIYFCLNRRFKQVLKSLPCCTCCDSISSPMSLPPSNNHQNFLRNVSNMIFGSSRLPEASNDLSSGTRNGGAKVLNKGVFDGDEDNSNSGHVLNNLMKRDQSAVIRSSGSNSSTILTMNNNATILNQIQVKVHENNLSVPMNQNNPCATETMYSSCRSIAPVNTVTELFPDDETEPTFEHFCLNKISDPDKYDIILCESSLRKSRNNTKCIPSSKMKEYDMTVRAARFVDSSSF